MSIIGKTGIGGMVVLALALVATWCGLFPIGTGIDERMYREATLRWLGGGPWYLPHQLAGPYTVTMGDVLYPPVMLVLFAPLSLLPPQLWYAVPLAIVAWSLSRLRPAWWAWALMLALCLWPRALGYWVFGNPKILVVAFLFVLAVASWRTRALILGVVVVLSIPFGSMWLDYLAATANGRALEYQWPTLALLVFPLVAWLGSVRLADPDRFRGAMHHALRPVVQHFERDRRVADGGVIASAQHLERDLALADRGVGATAKDLERDLAVADRHY